MQMKSGEDTRVKAVVQENTAGIIPIERPKDIRNLQAIPLHLALISKRSENVGGTSAEQASRWFTSCRTNRNFLHLKMIELVLFAVALFACVAAEEYPVVNLAIPGTPFEDLPYASWLQQGSNDLDISIEVATLLSTTTNGSVWMRVNAPVYRNKATGDIAPFGPLLRLKRGGDYKIKLTNNLVKQPPGSSATQRKIGTTNFHVHGIHESTGNVDRATASEYIGGDNVFIALDGKQNVSSDGESLTLYGTLSEDHLPGNHWYVH